MTTAIVLWIVLSVYGVGAFIVWRALGVIQPMYRHELERLLSSLALGGMAILWPALLVLWFIAWFVDLRPRPTPSAVGGAMA